MVKSYLRVVRRRWYVIPAVLLIALAVLFAATRSSVTVTSRVVVPFPGDQNDVNYQGIAQSLTVARSVAHDLHLKGETPDKLLGQVTVTQEYGTNIYDVSVHDSSKAQALHICDDWVATTNALYDKLNTAPAALAYSDAVQQLTATQQQITSLQQQITAFEYTHPELVNLQTTTQTTGSQTGTQSGGSSQTGTQSGSTSSSQPGNGTQTGTNSGQSQFNQTGTTQTNGNTTQQTNHTPGSVQNAQFLTNLESELASQQTMYTQLAQAVGNTQSLALQSTQKANAQVLDSAAVPPSNTLLLIAFTVLLGLLLGLGLIFAWEYFDRSLHTSTPLEEAFGSLAVIAVAARPSSRELRQVAPAAWAQPALPAAAASRPGHWPVATYALAALAATMPQAHTSDDGAADGAAHDGDGGMPGTNGHLNGHQPAARPDPEAYADYAEHAGYAEPGAPDTTDRPPSSGHQP